MQRLKEDFSISIIYITHDLTTAFQIGDNIIVLYRGAVAEAGGVEEVVQTPSHPYTQLLVGSIPNPNPDQPWQAEGEAALAGQTRGPAACKFVSRCPLAMDRCLHETPPMYRTDEYRAVACFLYEGAPVIENSEMDVVFKTPTLAGGGSTVTDVTPAAALA